MEVQARKAKEHHVSASAYHGIRGRDWLTGNSTLHNDENLVIVDMISAYVDVFD